MDMLEDSQLLFAQLATVPESHAVKTLIENHDAWQHNETIMTALDRTLRTRLTTFPRDVIRDHRIQAQRHRLQPLITVLPARQAAPAA